MSTFLSKKVCDILNASGVGKGRFGLEIELEGNVNGTVDTSDSKSLKGVWKEVTDGSLKTLGAKEFVFKRPLNYEESVTSVKELYKALGAKPVFSMRAGVHIHVNCSDLTIQELMTFLTCYFILEDVITETFGEDRVGNLFCLRVTDAEYTNDLIYNYLYYKGTGHISSENYRYAAANLYSLHKFGSVEFRALKSPVSAEPVLSFLDILNNLLNNSKQFNSPPEVVAYFSEAGDGVAIKRLVGDKVAKELMKVENFSDKIFGCLRQIQYWVFTTEWEEKGATTNGK